MKHIELKMTWTAAMPILIAALQDGTDQGKEAARVELMRLARALDQDSGEAPATEPEAPPATVDELEARRAELLAQRVQTNGHGRRARIQEKIDAIDTELAARDPFAPGAILYASWGYDQTNVDFYRIEKRAGDYVTLQKLETIDTPTPPDEPDGPATLTGTAVAGDASVGEPFRRKIKTAASSRFVQIESYAYAYPWDGQPMRTSSYA